MNDRRSELDEYKGEVDFDFFDDDDPVGSDIPQKDDISRKPPKSPKPPSPVNENRKPSPVVAIKNNKQDKDDYSSSDDSYSSDSVTDTESEIDQNSHNNSGKNISNESNVNGNYSGKNISNGLSGKNEIPKHQQSVDRKNDRKEIKNTQSVTSSSASETSQSESETESLSRVSPLPVKSKKKDNDSVESDSDSYTSYTSSSSSASDLSDSETESRAVSVKSKNKPTTSQSRSRDKGANVKEEAWSNSTKKDTDRNSDKNKQKQMRTKKGRKPASDSESEITDVSPLSSAQNSPRRKKKNRKHRDHDERDQIGRDQNTENLNQCENLDLNVLMDAVSELDKDKRIKANTRRVMFAPHERQSRENNYSYSKERAKLIEKENQRLLNEILHSVDNRDRPVTRSQYAPVIRRMTPSAINRERQQRKIEAENLALLRRLQKAKPTRGMSKAEQDQQYKKTMLYGVPVSTLHSSRPKSRATTPWDELSNSSRMGSRTRSLNSLASASTVTSAQSTHRSRPSSAKKKPEWNERW
ncbi:cilia- and flagella-associated protein 97 [Patella vulgata]|uniref:cilia- and flagella-associated protein 97 n=1 Tax=Patella vulgata TaxID=6465 RepID=UPI0024A889C6|nr:cilia- and flagella-associated protein 97 [Patella vulgata]